MQLATSESNACYCDMNTDSSMGNAGLESAKIADGATSGDFSQVVRFRLHKEEYGLNILDVQEIILIGDITEIPKVPEFVRG